MPFFRPNWRRFDIVSRSTAQGFAHFAQAGRKLRNVCALAVLVALLAPLGLLTLLTPELFWGCASSLPSEPAKGIEADAVISSSHSWYVFRFNDLRYLQMPAQPEAWNEAALQPQEKWLEISSPGGAFRPVQAVEGILGDFYLLDAAQGRLCLYDTGAQLLSTFPLPQELQPFTPGRMEVFRGADGGFTFVDYFAGEAWQYADRQGSEGSPDWVLRNRAKLPLGIQSCVQEPGHSSLNCVLPEGPVRLDASLNRIEVHMMPPARNGTRMFWDTSASAWVLEANAPDPQGGILFRFWPSQHQLETAERLSP